MWKKNWIPTWHFSNSRKTKDLNIKQNSKAIREKKNRKISVWPWDYTVFLSWAQKGKLQKVNKFNSSKFKPMWQDAIKKVKK